MARDVRDERIVANLGLCRRVCRKIARPYSVTEDEWFIEAMEGLADAVEKFRPERGYRFSTYAWAAISRRLLRLRRYEVTRGNRYPQPVYIHGGRGNRSQRPSWRDEPKRSVRDYDQIPDWLPSGDSLSAAIAELSDREQFVIRHRFGLGTKPATLDRIAVHFGVSRERVRQIEAKALDVLRETLARAS